MILFSEKLWHDMGRTPSWVEDYCKIVKTMITGDDPSVVQFFYEQHWLNNDPHGVHLGTDAMLTGITDSPQWPEGIPNQLLISLDPRYAVGGYKIPALMVTRTGPSVDPMFSQKSVDSLLHRVGIEDARISVEQDNAQRWVVSHALPQEPRGITWYTSHISESHLAALLESETPDEYARFCASLSIDLGVNATEAAVVFEAHRLAVATIHHIAILGDRRPEPRKMKIRVGRQKAKVTTYFIG